MKSTDINYSNIFLDVRIPLLVEAPQDQIVCVNAAAEFTCVFESDPPPKAVVWSSSIGDVLPTKPRYNFKGGYYLTPGVEKTFNLY